jgi:hypothetical protein
MNSSLFSTTIVAIAIIASVLGGVPAAAEGLDLKGLAGDLGVSEDQAIGGTTALLNVAKGNLGDDEFGELLNGSPELGDLMKGDHGMAKGAASAMAGGSAMDMMKSVTEGTGLDSLAANADLIKQFADLGMDAGMIEKFTGGLLDAIGGGGPGSGLLSPKTKLLRKGLGIL